MKQQLRNQRFLAGVAALALAASTASAEIVAEYNFGTSPTIDLANSATGSLGGNIANRSVVATSPTVPSTNADFDRDTSAGYNWATGRVGIWSNGGSSTEYFHFTFDVVNAAGVPNYKARIDGFTMESWANFRLNHVVYLFKWTGTSWTYVATLIQPGDVSNFSNLFLKLSAGTLATGGSSLNIQLAPGTYQVRMLYNNANGGVHFARLDNIKLDMTNVNTPPTAQVNAPSTTECDSGSGTALVDLDGSASSDTDGTIVSYAWRVDGAPIACTSAICNDVPMPVGLHTVQLVVTDNFGAPSPAAFKQVTVTDTAKATVQASTEVVLECVNGGATVPASLNTAFAASANDACYGVLPVLNDQVAIEGTILPVNSVVAVNFTAIDQQLNTGTAAGVLKVTDTIAPVLTLNGAGEIMLECGQAYTELGASANDQCDGALAVGTTGNVDTSIPGSYTVNYSTTDGAGLSDSAVRTVHVAPFFSGADSVIWSQPLARNGMSQDTDPSNLMQPDTTKYMKHKFKLGSTIPVKIRALDKSGTDVTRSASATVTVYTDVGCDTVADEAQEILYNGVGGAGGAMTLVTDTDGTQYLKYNIDTKSFDVVPVSGCYIIEVTVGTGSAACADTGSERVLIQRAK